MRTGLGGRVPSLSSNNFRLREKIEMQHFVVIVLQSVLRVLRICGSHIRRNVHLLRSQVSEFAPGMRSSWVALDFSRTDAGTMSQRWGFGTSRLIPIPVRMRTVEECR